MAGNCSIIAKNPGHENSTHLTRILVMKLIFTSNVVSKNRMSTNVDSLIDTMDPNVDAALVRLSMWSFVRILYLVVSSTLYSICRR